MRLIILFLLIPTFAFAQNDSLVLRFSEESKTIDELQQVSLQKQLIKRSNQINIKAFIGSKKSISSNRINVIYRLGALKEFLLKNEIPENQIKTERLLTKNEKQYNKIVLYFDYAPTKGEKVLLKTSTIEIVDIGYKKEQKAKKKKRKRKKKEATPIVKSYGRFRIEDFRKGEKIVIPNLIFYATQHVIERSSLRSLKHLVAILKDKPTMKIQLQGHICCKQNGEDGMDFGTETDNLSENRARAVYYYLIRNGIDARRLSYKGFGSKYKLVKDGGDYGRGRLNRRVEIFVVSE